MLSPQKISQAEYMCIPQDATLTYQISLCILYIAYTVFLLYLITKMSEKIIETKKV